MMEVDTVTDDNEPGGDKTDGAQPGGEMPNSEPPGFGQPPRRGRFKKGVSGNPGGRPKGSRNLKTDLGKMLKKRITVREDGEVRKITQQEAILLGLFNQALKGDAKARNSILAMCMKYDPPKQETETDQREEGISDSDQAILDDYVRRRLEDMKGQENEQSPSESDDRGLS
jgi:Family of unknown function (DUF5681)